MSVGVSRLESGALAYTAALMEAEDTDEALMLRYAQGDAAAFDTLYGRHRGGVFRYLLRHLTGNRAAAEELFQDVWTNLIGAPNVTVTRAGRGSTAPRGSARPEPWT